MPYIIRSAVGSLVSNGFIRFLQEHGIRVIGTDIVDDCAGKFVTDEFVRVPEAGEVELLVEAYNDIARKWNAAWILSGPEKEVEALVKNSERLAARPFHNPLETLEICSSKLRLASYLNEIDIDTPETQALSDFDQSVADKKKRVIKPISGRGSLGVHIVETGKLVHYKGILEDDRYVIQEYLDGTEYSVDKLHDFDGRLLNAVARERISTVSGKSIISKTVEGSALIDIIRRLSGHLVFRGANCIQFIRDTEGRYYLTDINPRFGGGAILSLKSSKAFRENLIHLLNNRLDKLKEYSDDLIPMKMYRGYEEFYEKL